ncbi:hypothetical protein ACWDAZ_05430 [Streptomyces sp. NPDC001215]
MDELTISYACLYVLSLGHGPWRPPAYSAYFVTDSPALGLRWVYDVVRSLPQKEPGGYLESRGLFNFGQSFRYVVGLMADPDTNDWRGAWLLADGVGEFRVKPVRCLSIVPLEAAATAA